MKREVPESDWKLFRPLSETALDRMCERILDEIAAIRDDSSRSHHDRYGAVYKLIRRRDKEVADLFDGQGRSAMILCLAGMSMRGLVHREELARFSDQTRERVELICQAMND